MFVTRNPRDVCCSYFNHWCIFEGFRRDRFDVFVDAFLNDVCGYYTPFFQNVRGFWELQKTHDNICFIFYEDMKRDLPAVIRRVRLKITFSGHCCPNPSSQVSAFLGKPVKEEDIPKLAAHLSFDQMKSNSAVNKQEWVEYYNKKHDAKADSTAFMNKGKAGNWRSKLSEEQIRYWYIIYQPGVGESLLLFFRRFEEWEERWSKGTDLKFKYD